MKTDSDNIKNIGSRIFANANGVLISNIDTHRLQPEWFAVAEEFVTHVIKEFHHKIHSMYLRGSVANGTAIQLISDIDFSIISFDPLSINEKESIQDIASKINSSNTFIARFDIDFYTVSEIVNTKEKILLKLRSVCMYGDTITDKIADPRTGKDICVTLPGLETKIAKTRDEIACGMYASENVAATCKWMAKRVLRGGLELVSKRAGCYTRDLYPCWETFSQYYPQYKSDMWRVLNLAVYPSKNVEDLKFVLELGEVVCGLAKSDTDFLV